MSVQPVLPTVYQTPRRLGRPVAPETPHQIIEGSAYEAATELIYYRDIHMQARLAADAACDDAVRRMVAAFRNHDASAFHAAADDYWLADSAEDDAASGGDDRAFTAHAHIRVVPAQVIEIEMGADPAPSCERLYGRRRARGGRGTRP